MKNLSFEQAIEMQQNAIKFFGGDLNEIHSSDFTLEEFVIVKRRAIIRKIIIGIVLAAIAYVVTYCFISIGYNIGMGLPVHDFNDQPKPDLSVLGKAS